LPIGRQNADLGGVFVTSFGEGVQDVAPALTDSIILERQIDRATLEREREKEREREFLHGEQEEEGDRGNRGRATTAIVLDQIES
jgi:hypothetical protein